MQDERDRKRGGEGWRERERRGWGMELRDCTLEIKIIRMRAGESERGRTGGGLPPRNKNAWEISAC